MSKPTSTEWCIRETQRLRALGLRDILVFPVPPSVNRIWRRRGNGKGMYKVDAATTFEAQVAAILGFFKPTQVKGPCALSILWFRNRRQGDCSNKIKSLEDAIKGQVMEDDREVAALRIERVEGAPVPHMRVMAYPWPVRIWEHWADSFPEGE